MVYLEQVSSALYLDGSSDVDRYTGIMDRLGVAAALTRDTEDLLGEILAQLR